MPTSPARCREWQVHPPAEDGINACLHLHDYAKSLLKPGITIVDYTEKVGEEATQQFLKIGLLKKSDVKNEDPENRAFQ